MIGGTGRRRDGRGGEGEGRIDDDNRERVWVAGCGFHSYGLGGGEG